MNFSVGFVIRMKNIWLGPLGIKGRLLPVGLLSCFVFGGLIYHEIIFTTGNFELRRCLVDVFLDIFVFGRVNDTHYSASVHGTVCERTCSTG